MSTIASERRKVIGMNALSSAGIFILIVSTLLNRFAFDIASVSVRIEHLALIGVGGLVVVQVVKGDWRITLTRDDLLLTLYLLIALVASALNAPDRFASLKFIGLMAIGVVIYWVVRALVRDAPTFLSAVKLLLAVGALEALFGMITWIAYPLGLDLVHFYPLEASGVQVPPCIYTFSPAGTLREPNIFGSYLAAATLLFAVLVLARQRHWPQKWLWLGLALTLVGVGLSLSRGAWLASLVGLLLVLFITREKPLATRLGVVAASTAIVAIAASLSIGLSPQLIRLATTPTQSASAMCARNNLLTPPTAKSTPQAVIPTPSASAPTESRATLTVSNSRLPFFATRLLGLGTIAFRLENFQRALEDWRQHPWIGNGANSSPQEHPELPATEGWISNLELMALHDTGIIGLLVFLAWLTWVGADVRASLKAAAPGFIRTASTALAIGMIALLVAYQFTSAWWLGFTWVYLGLIRAGAALLQRDIGSAPATAGEETLGPP